MRYQHTLNEFRQAIEQGLSFLQDFDYKFSGVREKTFKTFGAYFECDYENVKTNRIIRVVYLLSLDGSKATAVTDICLSVTGPVDDFDYTSTGSMKVCKTRLSMSEDSLEARLSEHLAATKQALMGPFSEAVAGRLWLSDQMDWGDLK